MKNSSSKPGHRAWLFVALLVVFLVGSASAHAATVVGLTDSNQLVLFETNAPADIINTTAITGLQTGESILGIDFRPSNGQLYAIGSTSRLYRINPATGAATPVGGSFAPALNVSAEGGMEVGFTFETVEGRIRVVSNGQSLRLDPDSGTVVAIDAPLFNTLNSGSSDFPGRTPRVTALAYLDRNPAHSTPFGTLYGINSTSARLVRIGSVGGQPVSPDSGEVFPVGDALASCFPQPCITEQAGFDITPHGLAFASLTRTRAPSSSLFIIDLAQGRATEIGAIGAGGTFLRGLAVVPEGTNLYAVTESNKLLLLNAQMPGTIIRTRQIDGLAAGEQVVAIDVRAEDEHLYALGSTSRIYRIDLATGAAHPSASVAPALEGSEFALANNPFIDQMRVTSDADKSWQLLFGFGEFPASFGSLASRTLAYEATDANAGQNPTVAGLAWHQNDGGFGDLSFAILYYGIDSGRDALVYEHVGGPGRLRTVGSLGVATNDRVGFDIGLAPYAALTPLCFEGCPTPSTLFTIDLKTGRATPVGGIGGGEIVRDIAVAPSSTIQFLVSGYRIEEDCTSITLTLVREGVAGADVTVDYATTSGDALPLPPADGRADYNATSGTLRFALGETSKQIKILINEDSYDEREGAQAGEAFKVVLSNPTGRSVLDELREATVVIEDDSDDSPFFDNAIDETYNFVCQQYHDFLNRDPDPEGFIFWLRNIESCFPDAACIERKRIETSAAFFLSIEYQETGFFVYRAHQAAYGRTPVPLTLTEFLRDVQQVAEGVVVGQPGALERLDSNKRRFISEFVNRKEFLEHHPPDASHESFIDALERNSGGGILTPAERAQLVNETRFIGRYYSLRTFIEDADFKRLASNRAFVLSQYFGYLRRNPADAPDADFSGYNFWLQKLEQHNGDFRAAEMVKAFINSGEYRRRFGAE